MAVTLSEALRIAIKAIETIDDLDKGEEADISINDSLHACDKLRELRNLLGA